MIARFTHHLSLKLRQQQSHLSSVICHLQSAALLHQEQRCGA
jgi:hypothetical protein